MASSFDIVHAFDLANRSVSCEGEREAPSPAIAGIDNPITNPANKTQEGITRFIWFSFRYSQWMWFSGDSLAMLGIASECGPSTSRQVIHIREGCREGPSSYSPSNLDWS